MSSGERVPEVAHGFRNNCLCDGSASGDVGPGAENI